jgi:hypothetical protein
VSELFRVYATEECANDGYPYAWNRTIKGLVREEAGNRCLRCRHPYPPGSGEWSDCDEQCTHGGPVRVKDGCHVEARWRILTTHHLNGVKADCRWWNLVPLCQRCHLTIQGKVKMNRPWPWEHTDWFKPYAAAFYAFKYHGQDLRRVDVEAALDELLALGRAHESEERMPV